MRGYFPHVCDLHQFGKYNPNSQNDVKLLTLAAHSLFLSEKKYVTLKLNDMTIFPMILQILQIRVYQVKGFLRGCNFLRDIFKIALFLSLSVMWKWKNYFQVFVYTLHSHQTCDQTREIDQSDH